MHIRPAPTCNTCLSERGHLTTPITTRPGAATPPRSRAWQRASTGLGICPGQGSQRTQVAPPQLSRGPPARGTRKVPEVPAKHADAVRWVLWMLHCQLPGDLGVMRGDTEDQRGPFTERVAYAKPPFTQSGWLKACREIPEVHAKPFFIHIFYINFICPQKAFLFKRACRGLWVKNMIHLSLVLQLASFSIALAYWNIL